MRRILVAGRRLLRKAGAWAAAGVFVLTGPPRALATTTLVNAGTVHYANDAGAEQAPVTATALFVKKWNPVITIVKDRTPASAPSGSVVEFTLTVEYTQTGTGCGDDAAAVAVTVTDTVPAGMTYVPDSTSVSVDASGFVLIPDGTSTADAAVNAAAALRVVSFLNPIPECSTGAAARVVRFRVTVD
jgi:uncharacterized repeat protein (TIGR01451 family)